MHHYCNILLPGEVWKSVREGVTELLICISQPITWQIEPK